MTKMQLTKRVELLFPRSGQVVAVQIPLDVFDQVRNVNRTLLSFVSRFQACVPNELLNRLRLQ